MTATSIQRLVEQQVAAHGDRVALRSPDGTLTYRQLNQQANAAARRLMAHGLRRGSCAVVCMPRGRDLAITLLAILKAGATYTWVGQGTGAAVPAGVSIRVSRDAGEEQFLAVDVESCLREPAQAAPNLPVVTRASDIACVLPDTDGSPAVLVPHATALALVGRPTTAGRWEGDAGALDLWLGLMSGTTVTVDDRSAQPAAA